MTEHWRDFGPAGLVGLNMLYVLGSPDNIIRHSARVGLRCVRLVAALDTYSYFTEGIKFRVWAPEHSQRIS